jgi:hypothetical protein
VIQQPFSEKPGAAIDHAAIEDIKIYMTGRLEDLDALFHWTQLRRGTDYFPRFGTFG